MGKRREKGSKSQTSPSSPCHSLSSSSSSDFEFTISRSPHKIAAALCPADELFYKGQLLPLQLSPRLSMVRTLILSSSSSSSDSATTSSRDSSGSSADSHSSFAASSSSAVDGCDSSRPSSAADDDPDFLNKHSLHSAAAAAAAASAAGAYGSGGRGQIKKSRYFSLSRFSSVFKKEAAAAKPPLPPQQPRSDPDHGYGSGSSVRRMSASAKEVFRRYLRKVRPLYEKLSSQQQKQKMEASVRSLRAGRSDGVPFSASLERTSVKEASAAAAAIQSGKKENLNGGGGGFSHSFSGNLRYPRRRSHVSSCPSSIRSSPSHSSVLSGSGGGFAAAGRVGSGSFYGTSSSSSSSSSMEELQNAIQGAIAYCKSSMIRNENMVSNEI